MSDFSWTQGPDTIVRKVEAAPVQISMPNPTLKRVKHGERMRFDAHVNVESLPQGKHLKKATIFSNVPNGGTFEVISDEGVAVGGRGSAPSPLMYFAAGVGLCLMSHVEMLGAQTDFDVSAARLEMRASFSTTMDLGGMDPGDAFGRGEQLDLNLIIESDEPEDRLLAFLGWCRRACMALQTVAAATPTVTRLCLNGEPLGAVGGLGAYKPQAA